MRNGKAIEDGGFGIGNQSMLPRSINVITYNVFGLKFIAKFRTERLREIGRRLAVADPRPEIVGLQECFTQEDFVAIRDQTREVLPYAKFYHSGIFGGGLAILSRWPIEESSMHRYSLNGRPQAFWRGDWYVGKGVACAKIRIGPGLKDVVEVFCTHMHAPYEAEPNDTYLCHRTSQAWEIAKLMRGAAERGHLVLGLGDFNMVPLSFAHRLIEARAPVKDAWRLLHPDSSLGSSNHPAEKARGKEVPSAAYNLTVNGAASDNVLNTWRWSPREQKRLFKGETREVASDTRDPNAKRLDYIFVGNVEYVDNSEAPVWEVSQIKVVMTERHPDLGCSLSDHFAVQASLTPKMNPIESQTADSLHPREHLTLYNSIVGMISSYEKRERRQRRLRLAHFGLSIIISLACFVAVWWSPGSFVSFLLMLVSTLGLVAGTLDGLIGGLFVGSELRALKEFDWDIKNAIELAQNGEKAH